MLELFNLSKVSGKRPVLNNISTTILDGDWIAIFGDEGCSDMLLRALYGSVRLKRGSTEMDGKTFVAKSRPLSNPAKLLEYSYMSAEGSFLWDQKISRSIQEKKAWFSNFHYEGMKEMIDHFGLADKEDQKACKLTEKERALFAMAFGMNCGSKYWLLDRSSCAMCNEEERRFLYGKMAEHCKAGGCVILVTTEEQLTEVAEAGGNRVIYLYNGGIIADEPFFVKNGKSLASRVIDWKKVGV